MYSQGDSFCRTSCMRDRCAKESEQGLLHVIDTAKEERMGYGRKWEFSKIPPGQVVIREDVAAALGVAVGDTLFIRMSMSKLLRFAFAPEGDLSETAASGLLPNATVDQPRDSAYAWSDRVWFHPTVALSVKVFGIADGSFGKMHSEDEMGMFMEYVAWLVGGSVCGGRGGVGGGCSVSTRRSDR